MKNNVAQSILGDGVYSAYSFLVDIVPTSAFNNIVKTMYIDVKIVKH